MSYLAGFLILAYLCYRHSKNQEIKNSIDHFRIYDTHVDRHRKVSNLP